MAPEARTRASNIWIVVGILLAAIRLYDFFFNGKHAYDLISGIGLILVAIGAYLNGFQTLEAIANSGKKSVVNGYTFALIGFSLAIASMVFKFTA